MSQDLKKSHISYVTIKQPKLLLQGESRTRQGVNPNYAEIRTSLKGSGSIPLGDTEMGHT